ncbi:TPA: FRG domain-containing protein [Streptococcus agalactiae]|nr:FRG domain-containing protein [Streptococcus agalactiae]HEM9431141.1 FRG domain-containing protein [Streptococcus agalactiae]HEM9433219.1 FRG domain-containing protein [Streptococcus agalactiae]HEM9434862.1 FRG domain-containing protein [Streptococcus agalactiae]HEM9443392.1 FRG domain-containing protein [Streptococcus agalactiae]
MENFREENRVRSVSEFVEKTIALSNKENVEHLYYRGESSFYPLRLPTLYRNKRLTLDGSSYYYQQLFIELGKGTYQNSVELSQSIAEFQHYGAITRYLDVTSNPLVARYFAVENEGDNGCIYCYKQEIDTSNFFKFEKFETGHTIAIKNALNFIPQRQINFFINFCFEIVEIANKNPEFLDNYRNSELKYISPERTVFFQDIIRNFQINDIRRLISEELKKENTSLPYNYMNFIYDMEEFLDLLNQKAKVKERLKYPVKIFMDLISAQIFLSTKSTSRIRQQQGAFIYPCFPSDHFKYKDTIQEDDYEYFQKLVSDSISSLEKTENFLWIANEDKSRIATELSIIGITKSFIYPGIETQSKVLLENEYK